MSYSASRDPNARGLASTIVQSFGPLFAPPSARDVAAGQQIQMQAQQAERQQQAFDQIAQFYGPEMAALAAGGQGAHALAFERMRAAQGLPTDQRISLTYDNFGNSPIGFREAQGGLDRRNAADNSRALEQTRLQQAGETDRNTANNQRAVAVASIGAMPADSVRPGMPSIAELYGIPELAQPQQSNITLRPGEIVQTPDTVAPGAPGQAPTVTPGRRIEGNPQQSSRAAMNVIIHGPNGAPARTAVTFDGVNDTLGQPLIRAPGERIASTYSVQGANPRDVMGATNSNATDANRLNAELAVGTEIIGEIRRLIRDNPGIYGWPGIVQNFAQDASQTLVEMMQAFGDQRPDMRQMATEIQTGLLRVAPEAYNSDLRKAQRLLYELAYFSARMNDPGGEVSREELLRNLESLRGGFWGNNQSVLAGLQALETVMNARRTGTTILRNPAGPEARGAMARTDGAPPPAAPGAPPPAAPGAPPPAASGTPERWERGPDGRPRPAQ